jgi:transcriptional regulator with XRE-family HTH domain
MGQRLKRAREEQGISVPELAKKIRRDYRYKVGDSTIRDVEKDSKTRNPGLKTVEMIALGLGLDPLEVISLRFDAPPELEPGYTESQFGQLSKVYKKVSKDNKRFADEFIKMLMEQMRRWRE